VDIPADSNNKHSDGVSNDSRDILPLLPANNDNEIMMEDEQDEHNVACFRSSLSQSGNGNMTRRLNYLHIGVTADNLFWPQLY
jgi:hypothetical protein